MPTHEEGTLVGQEHPSYARTSYPKETIEEHVDKRYVRRVTQFLTLALLCAMQACGFTMVHSWVLSIFSSRKVVTFRRRGFQVLSCIMSDFTSSWLLGTWLSGYNDTLLFQHLRQRTILVHRHEYVTAANKLLVDVELRYRGPFRILLDAWKYKSACNVFECNVVVL